MREARRESKKPESRWQLWLPAIGIVGAAVLSIVRVVRGPENQGTLVGLLLGLLSLVLFFALLAGRSASQLKALRGDGAVGVTFNLAAYGDLVRQLREVSAGLELPDSKLKFSWYYSARMDQRSLSIYGGFWSPRLLFSIPTSALQTVFLTTVPQGRWNLRCLEVVPVADSSLIVDLCPIETRWGFPAAARKQFAESLANDMNGLLSQR